MAYITILILLFLGIFNWIIEEKIYNPLTIICFMWTCITTLASLRLFGMNEISNKAFIIVTIGILGFTTGYWLIKYCFFVKLDKYKSECIQTSDKYDFNYKIIYFFEAICFIFYIWFSVLVIKKLTSGISYSMIRSMYQNYSEEALLTSKIAIFIKSWIAIPMVYLSTPIILISIFEKKVKRPLMLLCTCNIIMHIFCTSGRFVIQYLVIESILLLFIYKKNVPYKIKKNIKRLIVVSVVIIIYITAIRQKSSISVTDESVVKSIYAYICLCMPLLDRWVNITDSYNLQTYGMAFFSGIYAIFNVFIFKRIGITVPIYEYTYNIINSTEIFIPIFDTKKYNAFITMFYYFYLDFREVGVFIGAMIYGIICSISFLAVTKNRNIYNLMIFLLIAQGLSKSMVRWEFGLASYVSTFFYVIIFIKKNKSIGKNIVHKY